jgi:anaerobic magnesium-protoporphyrin IX monomethyl ester cyclase
MARVVFLQRLAEEWLGVMYISSMLKSHGHQCNVYVEPLERGDIVKKALAEPADIIAFSCLTSDYHWALRKAEAIKNHSNALIVFGGTHITLNPDEAIQSPNIDVICRDEGEYPMLELAEAIDRHEDFSKIRNLWVKKNGTVVKNEMRNLVADLDSLPHPDRELYAKYPFFKIRGKRPLHLSRGCPYDCSYCHNTSKKTLFRGKGKYVRWRSMESVLAEIEEIKRKSFVTVLHFIDDGFGVDREWLKTFVERLATQGGERLALQANMRADMVTEDLCETFGDYGAHHLRIRIAVECGDEKYRREILRKSISNEDLIQAADLFHRHGIDFLTYNMVGLPGETLDQALETLRLNMQLRPSLAICFVYQPYPGTALSDYALRKGFLTPEMLQRMGTPEYQGFYRSRSVLTQKNIREVENLHKIFGTVTGYPFLFPLVKPIVRTRALSSFLLLVYQVYVRKEILERRLRDKY